MQLGLNPSDLQEHLYCSAFGLCLKIYLSSTGACVSINPDCEVVLTLILE